MLKWNKQQNEQLAAEIDIHDNMITSLAEIWKNVDNSTMKNGGKNTKQITRIIFISKLHIIFHLIW